MRDLARRHAHRVAATLRNACRRPKRVRERVRALVQEVRELGLEAEREVHAHEEVQLRRRRALQVRDERHLPFAKLAKSANFANLWRARSRLYRNEILQENMRSTAFFKLYKICILLHRCNLKILAKNRFQKSANFVKIQQHFCKCRKFLLSK